MEKYATLAAGCRVPMAQVTSVQPLIVSTAVQRWKAYLLTPVDGASVAAFRILFGTLMGWEVARYFAHGWIERYSLAPKFHFTYPFLDFLRPWPGGRHLSSLCSHGAAGLA